MFSVFCDVDTEFLKVIYMNVIFGKVIESVNTVSVLIFRLVDFSFPVILIGFNFVIVLHL
jgi:hypothetical protein